MPRWRPLPEELDPQIREFTSQLRRLVDRSGLSVATIADRTGYSKSSWERYLGGRLLPPRGAAHALGEVTGIDIRHLETMWELAERAWSRDEMRHDVTMEAIRVAQAREALGEFWDDEPAKGRKWGRNKDKDKDRNKNRDKGKDRGRDEEPGVQEAAPGKEEEWKEKTGEIPVVSADSWHPWAPSSADFSGRSDFSASSGSPGDKDIADDFPDVFAPPSASAIPGARNSAAASAAPPETNRPPVDDETAVLRPRPYPGRGEGSAGGRVPQQRVDVASWGAAGEGRGPGAHRAGRGNAAAASAEQPSGPGSGPPAYPGNEQAGMASPDGAGAVGAAGAAGAAGDPDFPDGPNADGRSSRGRRVAALLGGALSVFAVLGVGVLVFGLPGQTGNSAASPTPSATSSARDLPAGVKCQGKDCSGKDPEKMGCGGQNVKSSRSAFVGPSMVEVRYSKVCKAAWGRITGAAQGDSLKISAGGQAESDKVDATNDAYTEMVSVGSATEARACATLVAGTTGCTKLDTAGQADTAGTASTGDPADTGDTAGTGDTSGDDGTDGTAGTGSTAGTGAGERGGIGDAVR
ncbi:DUF2690 domain-containing protein [Streptomyces winkii]|uniref:DUF2690 domain-containing protein n=1 Tax=Streptomyces winkii TaxID=3051178 RepID=UPI0028D2F438|nr:DUF2690 domain-containing protein [Streptomyces sp. DSM 40971]